MDINLVFENPLKDCDLQSNVPNIAITEECIIGIDEAGRGPVLGPMVYSLAYFPLRDEKDLKKLDFADSKTLTEEKREDIFEKIGRNNYKNIGWLSTVLSPVTISNSMFKRSKYNLNQLSHDTAIALIRRAKHNGIQVSKVFVDTVGPADKYEAKLKSLFPDIKFKVANKADSIYPIVSAASVCAKVIRDRVVNNWKFIEPNMQFSREDYGSGYPGDPKTKKFLSQTMDPLFGFTSFVRFSWSTIKTILDEKAIECEWEEEEDEDKQQLKSETTTKKISNYFNAANKVVKPIKKQKVNTFFKERNLKFFNNLSDLKF
ncbi:ribonuclease H2 subunit A-like [Oppia nitens]|uniref:ribonuclease H2 subunit A-like n=1 Tax=Oppia nitens TaxID=1686743 RepID=UPI0023DB90A0|nr:ribonuclease H2 subunit A-like [Oppia nitens]